MIELQVQGAENLARLAKELKVAGEGELRKELLRGIREAAKPMLAEVKEAARENLPKHGGLNNAVAASKLAVRTRAAGASAGVRVVGPRYRGADRGRLRHPTFGHDPWTTQQVKPGWFTETLQHHAPDVRAHLVEAIEDIARRLT